MDPVLWTHKMCVKQYRVFFCISYIWYFCIHIKISISGTTKTFTYLVCNQSDDILLISIYNYKIRFSLSNYNESITGILVNSSSMLV